MMRNGLFSIRVVLTVVLFALVQSPFPVPKAAADSTLILLYKDPGFEGDWAGSTASQEGEGQFPDSFVRYKLLRSEPDYIIWDEARQSCISDGGHLAVLASSAEHDAVSELAAQVCPGTCGAWIGLSEQTDGQFLWVTGEALGDFQPWALGEPDSHQAGCVGLTFANNPAPDYYWTESTCVRSCFNYLCEYNDSELSEGAVCPEGYVWSINADENSVLCQRQ